MSSLGETVLLIDDESIDLDTMRRILESQGFQVVSGQGYDDALRVFESLNGEIEMLIVDISLPGRSGVEIASQLLKRKRDLKVLFVSGYVGAEVIRFYGMSTTDIHFLRKPFHADELIQRVRDVLRSSEPMRWFDPGEKERKREGAKEK